MCSFIKLFFLSEINTIYGQDSLWTVYNTSNSGLPNNNVKAITIDGTGNKWIGAWSGGLTVYNEKGIVSIREERKYDIPKDFGMFQNYPNPFNPSTVISYQLPVRSFVSLKLYDITGVEIATLVNEEREAGVHNYELRITNSELVSGVYIYRLRAGDFVSTRKMIIMK